MANHTYMDNCLWHHGVLGMKWGRHIFGKRTTTRSHTKKINSDDIVVSKGSIREHVSGQKDLKLANKETYLYNPGNEHDASVYKGAYAKYIQKGKGYTKQYVHKYKTTENLISPSSKQRGKLFVEAYMKNPDAYSDEMNYIVDYTKEAKKYSKLTKRNNHISEYDKRFDKNTSETDLEKYGYDTFNVLGEYGSTRSRAVNDYYNYIKSKGYNSIIDDNNRSVYNDAVEPLIALNGNKSLKEIKVKELTPQEQQAEENKLRDYMEKKYGTRSIALSGLI